MFLIYSYLYNIIFLQSLHLKIIQKGPLALGEIYNKLLISREQNC